jgi:hypothetical protein
VSRNRLFSREVSGPTPELPAGQPPAGAFFLFPSPCAGWLQQVYALAYEQAAREVARAARLRRFYAAPLN